MKNIKRKIFQIILTVFMVFSSCFLTSTVEAVDDTGNAARSSGYFTNNLIVENTDITNENVDKGDKPHFIPSGSEEGSDIDFSKGENEGQVWINKKVDIIDANTGIFKITFQALGFKYRNVNENNNKENVWKNPLASDSTLTMYESIDSNFNLLKDDSHTMTVSQYIGLSENDVSISENNGTITLSFNADDVKIDQYSGGIAFDVEASFYVQVDDEVKAGTYETEDAISSFKPASDNFYYYEWGVRDSTGSRIRGLNWKSDQHGSLGSINHIVEIYIPDINGNPFKLSKTFPNAFYKTDNKQSIPLFDQNNQQHIYEYASFTQFYNMNLSDEGIVNIKFYASREGKDNDTLYLKIEIEYTNGRIIILEPHSNLQHAGGGITGDNWDGTLDEIIFKDNPSLREMYQTDTKGYINETFDNHGVITLALPSIENVKTKKTASLVDWDKREYVIDLYAASNLVQQAEPVDIMFALDWSGSMPWLLSEPSRTISFNDLNTDKNRKEYTVTNDKEKGTVSFWSRFKYFVLDESDNEYKPIAYFDFDRYEDDGWYAIKSRGRDNKDDRTAGTVIYNDKLKVSSGKTIYVKGENDYTKLEQLLLQTQSFIDSLASASPNSKVGFTTYAGYGISTTELYDVISLKDSGVSNIIGSSALEGNTSQGVGIQNAQAVLENKGSNNNQFIILFTDGTEAKKSDVISASAAADAVKYGNDIKIYTIGLANPTVLDDMKPHLTSWSSGEGYYYAASDYTAFENAFNSIFDDLVGSIKNVKIVDVIDERFTITQDEKDRLNAIEGVKVDGNKITWNISELKYSTEVEDGSHLWINIVAKDDFLGGNYIPTNVASESEVTVGGVSRELDKPVVNVKPKLELSNGKKTYFLGEQINPVEFIDELLESSNIALNKTQKETLITEGIVTVNYSYGSTDKVGTLTFQYEPIITDGKVSNLETHNASKAGDDVEEYKLTVTYDVDTSEERQYIIESSYSYTDNSFTDEHDNCTHTETDELIGKPHIANDIEASGLYIVNVVDGSIKINKTINNKVADPGTQGDTIVTFLIEGETVSGQNVHRYEVVRFNSVGTKSFTIDGLEKGIYTITELDSIRYDIDTINVNNDTTNVPVKVDTVNKDNKEITFYIGYANKTTGETNLNATRGEATYKNELINDENIGDTDVVTNKFSVNEDGSVTIQKDYYTVSQD